MNIGNGIKVAEPRAIGIRFERGRLIVALSDDREVSVPLSRYPTLQDATPAQRAAWKFLGPGRGFHWKSLDLDLSLQGLISGLPEVIPAPPPRRAKRRDRKLSRRAA